MNDERQDQRGPRVGRKGDSVTMKFVAARREGDTLIVQAHPEAIPAHFVEMRATIGEPVASAGEVVAGAICVRCKILNSLSFGCDWLIQWLTDAQVAEVCDLIGCHPLPNTPMCHVHYRPMVAVGDAWLCEACHPAPEAVRIDDPAELPA